MENYINEIPLVVKNSLKALCDENRQGILIYLLRSGSKSFIEISKELKISKNNLSHHIKTLLRFGLIYNFYNKNKFADKYSFYEISKLGKRIIDVLLNFLTPTTSKKEDVSNIEEPILSAGVPTYLSGGFTVRGVKAMLPYSVIVASSGATNEFFTQVFSFKQKSENELKCEYEIDV